MPMVASPFFAMEYIPNAQTITEFALQADLPLTRRLNLFVDVCKAVHYGHQQGILHRDLKPQNILVNQHQQIKVIDFGLARSNATNASVVSTWNDDGRLIGTLNYMSPEQCEIGRSPDVRSDVYSLGVVLYELCCRRIPHQLTGLPLAEALRVVQQETPTRPSQIHPSLRGDLDAILLKAINKNPIARYQSVDAMGKDISRYLNHEMVDAQTPTFGYQLAKFTRRNRTLVAAAICVLAAVLAGSILSAIFAWRAAQAESRAIAERDSALWQAYVANIAAGVAAFETGEFLRLKSKLEAIPEATGGWEWHLLKGIAETNAKTIAAHDGMITAFCVNESEGFMVSGGKDGRVNVWDLQTHELISVVSRSSQIASVAACNDRPYIASVGFDKKIVLSDAATGEILDEQEGFRPSESSLSFDSEGRLFAIDDTGRLRHFEIVDGNLRLIRTLSTAIRVPLRHSSIRIPRPLSGCIHDATERTLFAWSGRQLFSIDRSTGEIAFACEHEASLETAAVSKNGQQIATGCRGGLIRVWSAESGELLAEFNEDSTNTGSASWTRSLAFSPDGEHIVSGKADRLIKFWPISAPTSAPEFVWHGHSETVSAVHLSSNASLAYSASWDGTIRIWDRRGSGPITTLDGPDVELLSCAFSPDDSMFATAARDGTVCIWDPATLEQVAKLQAHATWVHCVAFSTDNEQFATSSSGGRIRLWNTRSAKMEAELQGHKGSVWSVAYDPNGKYLATGGNDETLRIWNLQSKKTEFTLRGHSNRIITIRYSPDGKRIATASRDKTVRIWDAVDGNPLMTLAGHESDVFGLAFSPDGQKLFTGSRDQTVRLWDLSAGTCEHVFDGHGQFVTSLALTPDGRRLIAGSWFNELLLWDVESRDLVFAMKAHEEPIRSIALSADGRKLATVSWDRTCRLWNIASRAERELERKLALQSNETAEKNARLKNDTARDNSAKANSAKDADLVAAQKLRGYIPISANRNFVARPWTSLVPVKRHHRKNGHALCPAKFELPMGD